jgi:hypothetical protein
MQFESNEQESLMSTMAAHEAGHRYDSIVRDPDLVATLLFSLIGLMLSFVLLTLDPDALIALGAY